MKMKTENVKIKANILYYTKITLEPDDSVIYVSFFFFFITV